MRNFIISAVAVTAFTFASTNQADAGIRRISFGGNGWNVSFGGRGNYGYHNNFGLNPYGHYGHRRYNNYYQPAHIWHDTSHYDYHPGRWIRHSNHYDYLPGHYNFHPTGHWYHNHP